MKPRIQRVSGFSLLEGGSPPPRATTRATQSCHGAGSMSRTLPRSGEDASRRRAAYGGSPFPDAPPLVPAPGDTAAAGVHAISPRNGGLRPAVVSPHRSASRAAAPRERFRRPRTARSVKISAPFCCRHLADPSSLPAIAPGVPEPSTYLPIQNREKISPSKSSATCSPVIRESATCARRSSSAANSGVSTWAAACSTCPAASRSASR